MTSLNTIPSSLAFLLNILIYRLWKTSARTHPLTSLHFTWLILWYLRLAPWQANRTWVQKKKKHFMAETLASSSSTICTLSTQVLPSLVLLYSSSFQVRMNKTQWTHYSLTKLQCKIFIHFLIFFNLLFLGSSIEVIDIHAMLESRKRKKNQRQFVIVYVCMYVRRKNVDDNMWDGRVLEVHRMQWNWICICDAMRE